jgi:hypothetical protein
MIRVRTVWNAIAIGCTALAVAVLAAWALGRVISDRWGWSQWLLWLPTPVALLAVVPGLLGACRQAARPGLRRRRLAVWAVAGAAVLLYFTVLEHRFLRGAAGDGDGLRLLHSSTYPGWREAREAYADRLVEIGADLIVLSNRADARDAQRIRERRGEALEVVTIWPFMVISPFPILEARPLVASAQIYVAMFQLDTSAALGRSITLYAVDLPSDLRLARRDIARAARRLLDGTGAPAPDVVVGDFNMTRGSASLRTLFPGLSHAYDQAGHGYGATFDRRFPLYHIDHVLLAETVRAADYALVDLETGRHLGQSVRLVPAQPRD